MNNWDIPAKMEEAVRKRDLICVYCHVKMKEYPHTKGTPGNKATWEHIDNNGPSTEWNIVRCCAACNSSKGTKKLFDWLKSDYCKERNIGEETVTSEIVKSYLKKRSGQLNKKQTKFL